LFVLSDLDGTLAPLAEHPDNVRLPEKAKTVLSALTRRPNTTVGILSGRSLIDLKDRVEIPGLILAGNHGLEIEGPDFHYTNSTALASQDRIATLAAVLNGRLRQIPGAWVENKSLSLSVHTRHVADRDMQRLLDALLFSLSDFLPYIELTAGIMVFEVKPRVDWTKGDAAVWIRNRVDTPRPVTIFLGDDLTDEDAFRLLPQGINVKVGHGLKTLAPYSVEDSGEVARFLRWVSEINPG
jgi:trehalose 6-phosphate phosphatase